MKNTIIKAETRGHQNHGWLNSYHTFSFANYYNPERLNFGALRVLNDDTVSAGMGFGMHAHSNMEIISIPLSGDLEHEDSMGNKTNIHAGEVQIMSAGSGIQHSEKNKNNNEDVKFLQIWIIPLLQNITPRYEQKKIIYTPNKWTTIVSPKPLVTAVSINQNAWFSIANFDNNISAEYIMNDNKNGVYFLILEGYVEIEKISLQPKDGVGFWEEEKINFTNKTASKILAIEVPLTF